ncbi:MAG: DUF72 domain-containing protein [Bacillota bacterium]
MPIPRGIHIGTSGWNYQHWKGIFYSKGLKSGDWLEYYSRRFSTVEINNSFYRLPEKGSFRIWRDSVPEWFIFTAKANRYLTHMKKLNEPEEALNKLLERLSVLENKLGPILFQFPPFWNVNYERLRAFTEILPDKFRYSYEFRNQTWWREDIFELLRKHNISFCIYEMPGIVTPKEVTSDFIYLRFHGPDFPFKERFDQEVLLSWAEQIKQWNSDGKEVFIYFNNDQYGYALGDAGELEDLLSASP